MTEDCRSILKRAISGSFREVNAKSLTLYVAKFCSRYDNCENEGIFGAPITGC